MLLLADIATTWYVIGKIGLIAEANPVMGEMMHTLGRKALIPAKVIVFATGISIRSVTDDGYEWVIPMGIIVPMTLVIIVNTLAVLALLL